MTSVKRGKRFSGTVEIPTVTAEGVRILIDGRERFMPFKGFPWFKDATIAQILHVEYLSPDHLWWPDLDVDLHVEAIDYPERFPLIWPPGRKGPNLQVAPKRTPSKKAARKQASAIVRPRSGERRAAPSRPLSRAR